MILIYSDKAERMACAFRVGVWQTAHEKTPQARLAGFMVHSFSRRL